MTKQQPTIQDVIEVAIRGCKTCSSPVKKKNAQYCSLKCWYVVIRKERPKCKRCGKSCKSMCNIYCSNSCKSLELFSDPTRHPHWNGGRTNEYKKLRNSCWKELAQWRKEVISRDKKCVKCESVENLQADHIKAFISHPDLRFEVTNGRTLCFDCHKKTGNYGAKAHLKALGRDNKGRWSKRVSA